MASLRRKLIQLMSLKKESGGGGGLPNEYQQVEYIRSTGGQGSTASNRPYIATDYIPNINTGIEIEFTDYYTNGYEVIVGTSNNGIKYQLMNTYDNRNYLTLVLGTTKYYISASYNDIHNFKLDKNGNYNMDGTTGTAQSPDVGPNGQIYIFCGKNDAGNASSFATCNIYKLKFYENDVLVRNFVPCYRKSDTVIGLYETVNQVFYTNQGTGAFTKGPDVVVTSPIYGIKRALNSTDPAWTRTDDAVGLVANAQIGSTAVTNNFDSIYPWSDIISYNYDVANDRINAYYGDSNFAFDGSNGDVLTLIPEFYYKRWQDSTYEYIQISKEQFEGSIKSEEFSIGRYTVSGSSSRVYSRSGYAPFTSQTIENFRTYANNLGEKFGQLDWHYFVLQMLYLVEYADYNSQAKLGQGYSKSTHTGAIISGGCNFLGMKSGSVDGTDNSSVIYRGVEDIFANIWQWIDGLVLNNRKTYICYNKDDYKTPTETTVPEGYNAISYTNSSSNGYIAKLGWDSSNSLISMPTMLGGSTTTYICDKYYQGDRVRILRIGGGWSYGEDSGLWFLHAGDAYSSANPNTGARLIKLK